MKIFWLIFIIVSGASLLGKSYMNTTKPKAILSSCVGCKWLYQVGVGYSNYTWEDDDVRCAKNLNDNLREGYHYAPCDWNKDSPEQDNWPITMHSRCDKYEAGPFVAMDVDGEDGPADFTTDKSQIDAICKHSDRDPHGHKP